MISRFTVAAVVLGAISAPALALADGNDIDSAADEQGHYFGLEELRLRRDITDLNHNYVLRPGDPESENTEFESGKFYGDVDGGSAGGYVTFGGPATSTFLGSMPDMEPPSLMESVRFGMDWRADVSGAGNRDYRSLGRSLAGGEIDRVGVRADLTALMNRKEANGAGSTAWRLTGMLGSTSLSLLSDDDVSPSTDGGGLLWDVGVGWSSGAMSVNAGYQSAYSLDAQSENRSAIAVLSLGADYLVLPGLSVYGEFNLIDSPLEESDTDLGALVILGTGVSF